ncbi:MAG: ferrous iron transport protein A [Chitinispirillales bacterium]|jgi:Fe2+ transport system protein FeoA|nr:ferrous iron transport protein A [Chitinispirillales bacterium]
MTLRNLEVGKSGRVLQVGGEKALRRRLLEMGITPRTVITVKKIAPMGDPVELFLRGYALTLRLEDAEKITIEKISENGGASK